VAASSLFESVLWPPGPPASALAPAPMPPSTPASAAASVPALVSVEASVEAAIEPPETLVHSGIELPELLADPVVGYFAERVYDEPRSSFSFNCGEFLGGIHDQSDNGSVTLFAGDLPLLIDSGAANDPVEGSPSSSHGHNIVLIDGRGQVPSGGGVGCTGRIVHAEQHPWATVITADLTAAYAARGYNPVHHAIRHCVFGKRPFTYLLIVDDFSRPRGERAVFEQLFHTPAATESELAADEVRMRVEFEGAGGQLTIRPLDEGVELERGSFTQHDALLFGEHPVWRLRRTAVGHRLMPTLVLPHGEGAPPEVLAGVDLRAGRFTLEWRVADEQGVDVLEIAPGSAAPARFTRDGLRPTSAESLLVSAGA
jgi:hypothetical protein